MSSNIEKVTISCQSVPGGWQTLIERSGADRLYIGPVYNKLTELWVWQRKNYNRLVLGFYDKLET